MATRPALNDPVRSFSHPIIEGPKKPPAVPTALMKASPPAAAMPVRNRVGITQKTDRAALMPTRPAVIQASESQKF